MSAAFDQLDGSQRRRVLLAERRSVIGTAAVVTLALLATFVSDYGPPWSWTTPDGATPWASLVVTLGVIVLLVSLLVPISRSRFRSPGPRRDLIASGELRDLVRVARDLGTGRRLDDRNRPIGRALLALTGRWIRLSWLTLVLGVVLVRVVILLPHVPWLDVALAVLIVLESLVVLVWAASARRHGAAQGLLGA